MKNKLSILALAATLATGLLASCASSGGTASLGGAKAYPLKTCIVTDNDLDSMGDEQTIVHQGQVVGKFKKNPEKYLAKLGS
jgi:hypothetical protein